MSLAADLWAASADQADAALRHPFVRALGDGSLCREAFQGYVAQDAFFLDCFARAYGLALACCTEPASVAAFTDLLAGVRDELRLHASYAEAWGVDMTRVSPLPATSAYTDFLLETAGLGDVGLTCAAMTPCMRLYAYLGSSLDPEAAGPYGEWVRTYADVGFEHLAASLEALLDRHAQDTPEVRGAYRRAMDLELGFFDAAGAQAPGRGAASGGAGTR
ncbi:MAG: TenA family protein [Mycobacteriales bacterium]